MSGLVNTKLRCPVCGARRDVLHPKAQSVRATTGYKDFVAAHMHNTTIVEDERTRLVVTVDKEDPMKATSVVSCKICLDVEPVRNEMRRGGLWTDSDAIILFAKEHAGCVPEDERS